MESLKRFREWFISLNKRGKSLAVMTGAIVVILILEGLR